MRRRREASSSTRRMASRASAQLLLAFLIAALVVAFALENRQRVTVDFLYGTRESRLVYVIFGAAIFGAVADRLLIWRRR